MINKISFYRIKKGLIYLKHYGPKEFLIRVKERLLTETVDYEIWYQNHRETSEELESQRRHIFKYEPLISIVVPVYNTPEIYLKQMIDSVRKQTYGNWELCIANANPLHEKVAEVLRTSMKMDARIRVLDVPENEGIAQNTNAALQRACGEFVGFLDHDDLLAENALFEVVKRLNKEPELEILYSDEDKVTEDLSKHFQPHFKPEFNLDLLRGNNYICHFCVIKRTLLDEIGGLKGEFNGAQDHELLLRCVEKTKKIARIPKILYHWRVHRASTSDNPISKTYAYDAGKRAVEEHLKRCGENAVVSLKKDLGFYRVKYEISGNPLISVLIPNKDHIKDLDTCLKSLQNAAYQNFEVIIIENNSIEKETFAYYDAIQSERIRVVKWDKEFNYSAINNYGAAFAKGEYLLLLNNDIEGIGTEWLGEMLANCQRKEVGIVGAKLYYPNNTIQHAGVILGIGGVAGHAFSGLSKEFSGYMHKANMQQNLSAVTAACMMVKRSVFAETGGLTEELAVAFNDIDFCLKVREKGYLVVYTPDAQLYHYESKSRGAEDTKEKVERFQKEISYMKQHWGELLTQDPMYNPNLTLTKWDYSLRS